MNSNTCLICMILYLRAFCFCKTRKKGSWKLETYWKSAVAHFISYINLSTNMVDFASLYKQNIFPNGTRPNNYHFSVVFHYPGQLVLISISLHTKTNFSLAIWLAFSAELFRMILVTCFINFKNIGLAPKIKSNTFNNTVFTNIIKGKLIRYFKYFTFN